MGISAAPVQTIDVAKPHPNLPMKPVLLPLSAALVLLFGACSEQVKSSPAGPPLDGDSTSSTRRSSPQPDRTPTANTEPSGVLVVMAAPEGLVSEIVKVRMRKGRRVVVYVGARWCEPCQYFEKAAKEGRLSEHFPNLTVVKFDLDRDKDRLARSGYVSSMIPLFALPNPDGRASGSQIQGSIKGPGAVANLVPRLAKLLNN